MTRYSTAYVLAQYRGLVGDDLGPSRGVGPATEDDVLTAAHQIHAADEPWTKATADKLVQALEGIVRQRRPRYVVERIPIEGQRPALVIRHDPEGILDNHHEAWTAFRRRAKAEATWTLDREAWKIKGLQKGSVDEVARRRGVSESTVHTRRRQLKRLGVDPDHLVRRIPDKG